MSSTDTHNLRQRVRSHFETNRGVRYSLAYLLAKGIGGADPARIIRFINDHDKTTLNGEKRIQIGKDSHGTTVYWQEAEEAINAQ